MAAISRKNTKIYITAADTLPSALTSSDVVVGEIKSYSKSGGEREVESDPVFGGFVDKEQPRSQFEIQLEVVPQTGTGSYEWDKLVYGQDSAAGSDVYTSALDSDDRMIVIEAYDGTNYKSWAFNNCNGITIDYEGSADDNQTATLTFKFAPTTSDGVPNYQYSAVTATSLIDWDSLDTE